MPDTFAFVILGKDSGFCCHLQAPHQPSKLRDITPAISDGVAPSVTGTSQKQVQIHDFGRLNQDLLVLQLRLLQT